MLLAEGVHVVITDRSGGGSAPPYDGRNLGGAVGDERDSVLANRHDTAKELGLDPDNVVFMRQVHSADVAYVREPFGDEPPALDAIFTDRPGVGLAVLVADCVPVVVADPGAGLVGVAHSGREGTFKGVVPALVEAMTGHGARPGTMVALVGPSACGLCYEVSPELRESAPPEMRSTTRLGTPALDVRAGVTAQLRAAGVLDVRHDERCTIESPELFSYRRERVTGRFAAYAWLAG
ncbi:peptidoglycan editing factor PgeF [Nonomuraea sp. NPDC049152]|uniref:peptidoglycan editing factor PgeF n=1 Tax=Nonomuraea sp. NPDC049152 TaxID=3154350 RepID=UPI0033CCF3FD